MGLFEMSYVALLVTNSGQTPRAVQISLEGNFLNVSGAHGSEAVPIWKLFRSSSGTTLQIRRVDRPGWELRLSGKHPELAEYIGEKPLARGAEIVGRLGKLKIAIGLLLLIPTLWQALPARWIAKMLPGWAQERMVGGYISGNARRRCTREGGEEAMRKILVRLDRDIGKKVEIVTLNFGNVMVTALPANKVMIMRGALGDIDAEALAALLAHEIAHLRHGDATTAMVRYEGKAGTLKAIMQGEDRKEAYLEFSGPEEERADREAIAMMQLAGITLKPAAAMFKQMTTDEFFAPRQRDFHFGMAGRARAWTAAAAQEPADLKPLLTQNEADDLFNSCWPGLIRSYPSLLPENLRPPLPAGTMTLNSSDKQP